ncbi:unnamed protein product [Caenorhabditis sp. 36 PRJEB53466]|nr:unnamed protein product [Caenorhabditis sp. 36 PRJEB53466]
MQVGGSEPDHASSHPCTPQSYNPMTPSTSRIGTPVRPPSQMSAMSSRPYPSSPFRAQNMEPANSRLQELREAAIGRRAQMSGWMQNGYGPPPGQMQPPRPGSYMGSNASTMSTATNMSNMSGMTNITLGGMSMLSVNTEMDMWMNPAPHERMLRVSYTTTENQDPMKMRMSVQDMIKNLKSADEENQRTALRMLGPIVQASQLDHKYPKDQLTDIIAALFELLLRPVENEPMIRKTFEILFQLLHSKTDHLGKFGFSRIFNSINTKWMKQPVKTHKGSQSIFDAVVERARIVGTAYETRATLLLLHMCSDHYLMKKVFSDNLFCSSLHSDLARRIIEFAVQKIRSENINSKCQGFAVSIIRTLSSKSKHVRKAALSMDVVKIFFEIMRDCDINEDLIWSTVQGLTVFCKDPIIGDYFVRLGGVQVLCQLLTHGSSRLIHELLKCLSYLSDLPAIQEHDMTESIHTLMQVLGSSDIVIVNGATGTLRNIALHNKMNKVIMVQKNVTHHVFDVLKMAAQFKSQPIHPEELRVLLKSVYENCFSILSNVTSMGPQENKASAVEACRRIANYADAASILLLFFNVGNQKCRKITVTVMKRVIETVPRFAEPFVDLVTESNDPLTVLLLQRAYESHIEWQKINAEIMNSTLEPSKRRELDESRTDHEEIAKRSFGLLTNLCTRANPRFIESVMTRIINNGFNPFTYFEMRVMSDAVLTECLTFILGLCKTPENLERGLLLHLLRTASVGDQFFMSLQRQSPIIQNMLREIWELGIQQNNRSQNQMGPPM